MATAPPILRPRTVLHVRGSWSARDDRIPSAVWLGIFWIGMIAGFGVDIPGFLRQQPPAPKVIYVHAFVFTVWLFILTAQVLLVLGDRVAWHKKMGWFAAFWASLMAVLGPWAALSSQATDLHTPLSLPGFLSVNLVDIAGFLILLVWGFGLRRNPAAHRRMMMLATVSLADPGFSRFDTFFLPHEPHSVWLWFVWVFYGNVLLIALMAAWDWWRGRLMRSFVIGAAGLLVAEYLASALYFWGPWKSFSISLIRVWVKL